MTSFVVALLLALASISLGLRTTSLYAGDRMHPVARLALAVFTGGLMTALILQVCSHYRIFEFGLGLLLSLSPAGVYDLAKWWFRRSR
ncbi:MAG: hypothetical protein Q7R30_10450 [Acidobacteriota bacterium]|nr:hypothetical protein [Acidobacteriota bacterium]